MRFLVIYSLVSAVSAGQCKLTPPGTCYSNGGAKIAHLPGIGSDPQKCCDLCAQNPDCASWNHGSYDTKTKLYACDLYSDVGPTKNSSTCVGGVRDGPLPPTPAPTPPAPRGDKPNIVFLVVESTDGRTWQRGYSDDLIPMPAIRGLQEHGVAFHRHYSNAPVCCPSRATFWSGRHAHKIPHQSKVPGGPSVQGAWNNYEGLPADFDERIDQVLGAAGGYNAKITGKTDWSAGGHSENVYLNAWTMYTQFPYDIPQHGGWGDESGDCASNGGVRKGGGPKGEGSAHAGDWAALKTGTQFIADAVANSSTVPFFIYQGMNIVHPPYQTNEYWYDQIDPSKISVPEWLPLEQMHPCDLQSSMLKKCTPSDANAAAFYNVSRRANVRRIYAAMVAEFSEMVGGYVDAVNAAGVMNQTVFIVTSDHGDMQMEHQQHYKMVPREASSSVPMVIFDGRPGKPLAAPRVVMEPSQLIDIFPTIMDYAEVPQAARPADLDGASLMPFMASEPAYAAAAGHAGGAIGGAVAGRPGFVTSQFHGDNIAMSWFLVVQNIDNRTYKLIQWGTGKEVLPQLFDLTADPQENDNLLNVTTPDKHTMLLLQQLDASLQTAIPYPGIAQQVAQYNKDSFAAWVNSTQDWQTAIHKSGLRWDDSWNVDPAGAIAAVNAWAAEPATVLACRSDLVWPPKGATAHTPLL
jgi:arylsulfatase A-like enzyme